MKEHLLIIAKEPIAGLSKTRLEKDLGPHTQVLYKAFMEDFFLRSKPYFEKIKLAYTPASGKVFFEQFLKSLNVNFELELQSDDLFFSRIKKVFKNYKADDFIHLTGSDIPDFPFDYIVNRELEKDCVYLGPDEDGGYYYLGTQAKNDFVFDLENVEDGDEGVFSATKKIIKKRGLKLVELPLWSDIDTLSDLKKFQARNKLEDYKTLKILEKL